MSESRREYNPYANELRLAVARWRMAVDEARMARYHPLFIII